MVQMVVMAWNGEWMASAALGLLTGESYRVGSGFAP
jgi:hypothetical protein